MNTKGYRLELLVDQDAKDLYMKKYGSWVVDENPENAGVDLFVSKDTSVGSDVVLLNHGVKARMVNNETGEDCHYWLVPRSSIFKSGVMMANSVGVIDRTYRGSVMGPIQTTAWSYGAPVTQNIKRGQRLFQIVAPDMGPIKYVILVDSLPESRRSEGGFGSTGQ
jgi:dUTP pyrophosphatase